MRQPYQLSIALRYLRTRSENSFISFISSVSMLGIALAVALLIVVQSVFNGFEVELQKRVIGISSDATLTGADGPVDDWRALRKRALEYNDVTDAAPFVEGEGMVMAGETFAGVEIRGIDPGLEQSVSSVAGMIRDGSLDSLASGPFNIVIGSALADLLNAGVGSEVIVLLAEGRMTPAGFVPRAKTFTVGGIFDAGMYEYDRGLVLVSLDDAELLFRTAGRASGLSLAVTDVYRAGTIVADVAYGLGGGFYITDWARQHAVSFRSIQLTKSMFFVILSLVVAVAAFNIVSTLVMVVRDKRGDIAILRSVGAAPGGILAVFAGQGTLIGLIGAGLGVLLGIALVEILGPAVAFIEHTFGIELMSAEAYFISDLPARARWLEVGQIAGIALLLAIAATLYPAFSAARQPPAKALRYD
jgi:lipoprotein-releasing system permease protein